VERHSAGLAVAVPLALMTTAAAVLISRAAIGAGGESASIVVGALAVNVVVAVVLSTTAVWLVSGVLDGMDERLLPGLVKLATIHTVLALCISFGIVGLLIAVVVLLALLQWLFDLDTMESVAMTLVVALMHVGALAATLVLLPYADGFSPLLTGFV
jgi:hypothetical protein